MTLAAEYLETQVFTATPHRLHLMVVDAAIRWAQRGLEALNEQRWDEMDLMLSRARHCVTELIRGLKPDQNPELVEPQKTLFVFALRKLAEGDFHRDAERVSDALRILQMHRETWLELGEAATRQNAAPIPGPHARSWLG